MKRIRFTEEQIIGVLKEHEAGAKTADLARKHGVSEATLYNWKAKFGGLEVSEAKRLKALEDENAKLKKLLAEQMLDLNRPRDPSAQRSDPLKVASDVVRLTTTGAEAGVRIAFSGDAGLEAAMSPDSLKQVLLNLVQNAREAQRSAGTADSRVDVTVRRAAEGVEIAVEDNGPGVPQELRNRIFDPFFTTKSAVDGVGLGLFVAEGLVRSAGGRLTLDRTSAGARFIVELPKAAPATDQREAHDAAVQDPHRR